MTDKCMGKVARIGNWTRNEVSTIQSTEDKNNLKEPASRNKFLYRSYVAHSDGEKVRRNRHFPKPDVEAHAEAKPALPE